MVWSCSPEQIGVRTEFLSWASACASWLSISIQNRPKGSSSRARRRASFGLKFTLTSRQMSTSGPTASRMAPIWATAWRMMSRLAT